MQASTEGDHKGVIARLRVIDLFAGCGGLTAGFRAAGGYRTVAAVEKDLAAAATYAANFEERHVHWGGIEGWVTSGEIPEADIVVGGPPCQGFSNLGARRERDPRNALWRRYVDVLVAARPRVFLLENVDRFATSGQCRDLVRETYRSGRLRDYTIDCHIVRATDHGAAQLRRRTIVIGTHRDLAQIQVPRTTVPKSEWRTVKDEIGGLSPIDPDHRDLPDDWTVFRGHTVPGRFSSIDLHVTRRYEERSLERFASIPPGGNRTDLPDNLKAPCWLNHDTGSLDVMGRMHWDRPSVTIRTEFYKPEKGRYLHPDQDRAISHYEAARLQGFPDDYLWCGTKVQIARQIGNAVPVPLAQSLATYIRACMC
ncbi:DNA cytosine methyltransferase [Sporichthya sp.]|uniref:DNA cytosine methyltransferase n=1 Tax=Sporichthya sp. TaxID=65475 RepID=UPI0025F14A50|nr:DNA cytosine methyltransferase [Sporichthya sp.]